LKGGTKYTINIGSLPASQLQNISRNLKTRTSYLNLPDVKVQIDVNNLEIIAGKDTNVNQLLFPGYLECNIEEGIILKDDTASLQIGSDNYTIKKIGENFLIDNITHAIGDTLYLADMKTTIVNKTNTSVIISLTAFNSSDIGGEIAGYSQTSFDSNSGKYSFNTLVRLSSAASKRFNEITQNIKTVVIGNQISLDSVLVYKLDGEDLGRLGMPANLKGQNISTLYIIVSDASKESLLNKKNIVEASINAGSLPEGLSISGKRDVAATEEKNITPLLGVIIFLIGIIPLFFIMKYKKIKHNLLSILVGTAEIFSIVSLFIAFQVFYKLNFAFDFAALLGIVLLSFNWAANVISTNLHTHAQKELIIKIKYKKLVSVTGLIKILLVMFSFVSAAYGYQSASVIIFSGIFLDYFIYRPFYKNFIS
jgi:hypothetical protein